MHPGELASHPWWKAKKWVLHISYRLFNRYSELKYNKEGNDKVFGEMFVVSRCGGGGWRRDPRVWALAARHYILYILLFLFLQGKSKIKSFRPSMFALKPEITWTRAGPATRTRTRCPVS